jgi:nucleoside 2-deoxyribosyltransferase
VIIYIASPLGFSEPGRLYLDEKLIPRLERDGHTAIDPWKLTDPSHIARAEAEHDPVKRKQYFTDANMLIGENNARGIDGCGIVLAILDGTDVDSGTAAEIGYATAKGKQIVGLRTDFRLSADNEGSIVNLQVEYFIRSSGGSIFRSIDECLSFITLHTVKGKS